MQNLKIDSIISIVKRYARIEEEAFNLRIIFMEYEKEGILKKEELVELDKLIMYKYEQLENIKSSIEELL
jgi:hypothetical protein